jgi:hypothetical protein
MSKDKSLHLTAKELGLEDNTVIHDSDALASDAGKPDLPWEKKGKFTWGGEFICFLPDDKKDDLLSGYIKLARCTPGEYDSYQWQNFAEKVCFALNNRR